MNDNKRLLAALLAAMFFVTLAGVAGMWIYAERRIAQDWRGEAERQRMLAEATTQELNAHARALEDLRSDNARQRASAETLAAELRSEVASQRTMLQNVQDQFGGRRTPTPLARPTPRIRPPRVIEHGNEGFMVDELGGPRPAMRGRAWGPEQVIGAPDTPGPGDQQTAWASRTQDGQPEWLDLDYAAPVKVSRIKVYETYNPGALVRVTVFDDAGKEVEVWKGIDPVQRGAGMGTAEIPVPNLPLSKRVKIYLDSVSVPGWNEIDAVGIVDEAGKTHWATGVRASTTYAEQDAAQAPVVPNDVLQLEF